VAGILVFWNFINFIGSGNSKILPTKSHVQHGFARIPLGWIHNGA
jgi:hypothetical protein